MKTFCQKNSEIFKFFMFLAAISLSFGCSSKLIVKTTPPEAQISVGAIGSEKMTPLGKSPLEINSDELKAKINVGPSRLSFMELLIEKENFEPIRVWIPTGSWGNLSTEVKLLLNPMRDSKKNVETLVQHLFNAKSFAEKRQYGLSHNEVDKALKIYPNFSQAMALKGAIFFMEKDYPESLRWYQKSVDTNPSLTSSIKMIEKINQITK